MYYDTSYKDRHYPFPKDEINPKQKGEKWCLNMCKAIYARYVQNKAGVRYTDREWIAEMRLYAAGRQSSTKYKDILLGEREENRGEREGWMNVDFEDIFSPAPKYMSIIQGYFENLTHKIDVNAEDERSTFDKGIKKEELWFKKQNKAALDKINQNIGIQTEDEYLPQTRDELDMFEKLGGIKLPYEIGMIDAISHTMTRSNWKKIKRKLIEDLVNLGQAALMDEVDVYTQKEVLKYVDIQDMIIEYSKDGDFEKSKYGGIPLSYTTVELRTSGCDLSEEELLALANKYVAKCGNPDEVPGSVDEDGNYAYDDYRFPVVYFAWISTNKKYQTKRINKRKQELVYEEKFGKVYDTEKRKTTVTNIRTIYHAKWIVGTEHIFDYGMMNDIPRIGKDVRLPFHVYKIHGKPLMETMKPLLDDLMLAKLRLQNAFANAPPSGLMIEYESLENMTLGNKDLDPKAMIKMYRQTGDIVYKSNPYYGQINYSRAAPIQEMKGGAGAALNEAIQVFELCFNLISEMVGIDRVSALSGKPDPNLPVHTTKAMMASTNNVLRNIYTGVLSVKESVARNVAYRIQLICIYNKEQSKGYAKIIGQDKVDAIKMAGDKRPIDWGLNIVPRPTDERRAQIEQAAVTALQAGKNGIPLITYGDYLYIGRLLDEGKDKYAEAYLSYKETKTTQQEEEKQQRNIMLQNQGNKELEIEKAKADKEKVTHETNEKIREQYWEAYFEMLKEKNRNTAEMEKIAVELGIQSGMQEQGAVGQQPVEQKEL